MNNLNGILLMIAAMAGFALEDLFVKLLSSTISTGQILIVLGACSSIGFALMAYIKGHNIFAAHVWTRATIARASADAIAAVAFVTSLSLVPISTVAAVFQVTPLVITMGAALFLGEQVGWRRWTAITVGFIGVLIIIRPGLSGFDPAVLLVLISVVGVAARDLITRRIPENVASTVISFQAFASLIVAGTILLFLSSDTLVAVSELEAAYFVGGVFFGGAGYYGIVAAMRVGDASTVTPFRYTRLLFSLVIGVLVFNERPDALTLLGAAIVIGTGFFTFLRERRALSRSEIRV
ncbi:DMT family transporter [Falsihalocynthiibacter arcticus]|uniref:DMT family transporter n=1 Tax=Falsihalocynthiibacter arcticus TaxID=1579316 RepID=UPI0030038E8D